MADITMPKMGFDMTEGTIVKWLKQVGDEVKKGEPIAEIETDKVTIEIEAFDSGTLTKIVAEEGAVVPVGDPIAQLDGDGAGAAQAAPSDQGAAVATDQAASGANVQADTTPAAQAEAAAPQGEGGAPLDREQGTVTASGAAGQTEAAASSAGGAQTASASSDAAETAQASNSAPASDAPRSGYGSDVTAEEEVTGQETQNGAVAETSGNGAPAPASPVAKRLARENNVNLTQITGSGPGGRIVRNDVEAFMQRGSAQPQATAQAVQQPVQQQPQAAPQAAPQPAPQPQPAPSQPAQQQQQAAPAPAGAPLPGTRREPLSRMRQTIARRLVQSKAPVPHFYVTTEIDMGAAMDLREQLNASGDVKITVNEIFVKATAIAMTKFPALNASWSEDALEYHEYINVGIAVATDNGLLAPAVTDVDKKSLGTLSREAKELIKRTRDGKATLDELQRGTYSTSNLGMYPVDSFVAIINPPQATNIAVGAVTETPVVRNGEITIGRVMKATISVDHRVSDGAVAAEYMQELKRVLENPMLILL